MKKNILIFLGLHLIFFLTGCSKKPKEIIYDVTYKSVMTQHVLPETAECVAQNSVEKLEKEKNGNEIMEILAKAYELKQSGYEGEIKANPKYGAATYEYSRIMATAIQECIHYDNDYDKIGSETSSSNANAQTDLPEENTAVENQQILIENNITDIADHYFIRDDSKNIVTDTKRGFMWQDQPYTSKELNFANDDEELMDVDGYGKVGRIDYALEYCKNLKLAGYDDWILPSKGKLMTIADEHGEGMKIKKAFKNITIAEHNSYMTSTESDNPDLELGVWTVNFNKPSDSYVDAIDSKNFIRCVRYNR